MKRWTQRTWIKIIAVALSLSLIAAAVALVLSGTGVSWTGWAETVSRPFSRLAATVTGWAEQGAAYFQGVEALQAEKAALEEEVAQLQAAAAEIQAYDPARELQLLTQCHRQARSYVDHLETEWKELARHILAQRLAADPRQLSRLAASQAAQPAGSHWEIIPYPHTTEPRKENVP